MLKLKRVIVFFKDCHKTDIVIVFKTSITGWNDPVRHLFVVYSVDLFSTR